MDPGRKALMLVTAGACALLLLPGLVREGMFMDGMLYTVVAHNEARGIGTFWQPRFSQLGLANMDTFHEHPPLGFGMQALWFRTFGSAFWVERAYALTTALLMVALLLGIWRELTRGDARIRGLGAWPVLLWGIVPQVFWCTHNNMLENTMGLFTTGALWCALRGLRTGSMALAVGAGSLVFLATFTKGVPGLFPLGAPFLWWLFTRQGGVRRMVLFTVVPVVTVVLVYLALWQWPDARANLEPYVEARLMHRIAAKPTVEHRWQILLDLFNSQLGPIMLAGVLVLAAARGASGPATGRPALALMAIGLSGVAPMMLTLVQKSFYSVPAFPPIALGLALWSAPALERLLERIALRRGLARGLSVAGGAALLTALATSVLLWGRPGRDADMLHDVARIGATVPQGTLVGCAPELWEQWNLQGYLLRYHDISLDPHGRPHSWFLAPVGNDLPGECHPEGTALRTLRLARCTHGSGAMK
ncbi:MAG: glycosyltransferase family 39 protein [Flavobacteriales bacterium]|nr:glycosyltransferase family 39 protein [Flavobacteriales bacterium]